MATRQIKRLYQVICPRCGVMTTTRDRRKKWCGTKCWYARNTLPSGERVCGICRTARPLSEFTPDKRRPGTGISQCKSCRNAYSKEYTEGLRRESLAKWFAYRALCGMKGRGVAGSCTTAQLQGLFEGALATGSCPYCGVRLDERNVSTDHVVPVSRGGTNDTANLHITCLRCNFMKGNLGHEAFRMLRELAERLGPDDGRILQARLLAGNSRFYRKAR